METRLILPAVLGIFAMLVPSAFAHDGPASVWGMGEFGLPDRGGTYSKDLEIIDAAPPPQRLHTAPQERRNTILLPSECSTISGNIQNFDSTSFDLKDLVGRYSPYCSQNKAAEEELVIYPDGRFNFFAYGIFDPWIGTGNSSVIADGLTLQAAYNTFTLKPVKANGQLFLEGRPHLNLDGSGFASVDSHYSHWRKTTDIAFAEKDTQRHFSHENIEVLRSKFPAALGTWRLPACSSSSDEGPICDFPPGIVSAPGDFK